MASHVDKNELKIVHVPQLRKRSYALMRMVDDSRKLEAPIGISPEDAKPGFEHETFLVVK